MRCTLILYLLLGTVSAISDDFPFGRIHEVVTSGCPNPSCIIRNTSVTPRTKRTILKEIKTAANNQIDSKNLKSSFSQGYIDLRSRSPLDEGAATLAFVFDTTGSMYDDLKQVIDGAGKILRTVLEKFERPIHNYVLVPFNDPDIGEVTATTDPAEFQNSLHLLQYSILGGGDCPEMALEAIKAALNKCLPSSYIYVFTDARAKDYHLLDEILRLIQWKQTQVVFVMTGDCGDRTHPGYTAFEAIASTSSGQMFHLNKSDVKEVLNFVRLSLESRKVNLLSLDSEKKEAGKENLNLLVDKTIRQFTISVAGEKPQIDIYKAENGDTKEEIDELLNLENVKVVGVKEPSPGLYNISVGSDSKYTVRATGLSSINFETGFALQPTTSFKETYHRPIKGGSSHILIKPTDRTEFGDLHFLELLSLDGHVLASLPLQRLPGEEILYGGTEITAPEQPFNVKVYGRDKDGTHFERFSTTALISQSPGAPDVLSDSVVSGFYDRPALLKCHVQTLVPFNLTWLRDGHAITRPTSYPQTAEVVYEIGNPTTADEATYRCVATNIAGTSSSDVYLDMNEPPPIVNAVRNVTLLPSGNAYLTCNVFSTVEYNVTWMKYKIEGLVQDFFGKNETIGEFLPVSQFGTKYIPLKNNSLSISDVRREDDGWYRCTAQNIGGTASAEMHATVPLPPTVRVIEHQIDFTEDSEVTLICTGTGEPRPEILWVKDNRILSNNDRLLVVAGRLVIGNAQRTDEGKYRCIVRNAVATVEESVNVRFIQPPTAIAVDSHILAESGSTIILQCIVDGSPAPEVEWFREDGSKIYPMSFVDISGGYLRILGVQEDDAGSYECKVTNVGGEASDTMRLDIGSAPFIRQKPIDTTIQIDGNGALSCYGSGVPEPELTWTRADGRFLSSRMEHDPKGVLKIQGMQIEDEGVYSCHLENMYGRSEAQAQLTISGLVPPIIASPPDPRIKVLSSESLSLPCTIVMAKPSPVIEWTFQGRSIGRMTDVFVNSIGTLQIPSTKSKHEGTYECIVRNMAGNSSLILHVNVLEPPSVKDGKNQQTLEVTKGRKIRLKCPIKGDPQPTYSWQKDGRPLVSFQRKLRINSEGSIILREVDVSDAGVYVCTAVNAAGITNAAVTLKVLAHPTIASDPTVYNVMEGDVTSLHCRVNGSPTPQIKWTGPLEKYNVSVDGTIRVKVSKETEGEYKCTAHNQVGVATRIVKLIMSKFPKIKRQESVVSSVVGQEAKIPCQASGYPVPRVTWLRNGNPLPLTDKFIIRDGYLLIKSVSPNLDGNYTCHADNRAGSTSHTVQLVANYAPIVPDYIKENLNVSLLEGSSVSLPCPAIGHPTPRPVWTRNGFFLATERNLLVQKDSTVIIRDARSSHSGIYECTLTNSYGKANITYNVQVMIPPRVAVHEGESIAIEGDSVTIRCPVDAFPIPSIDWLKDGISIFSTKDRADVTHIVIEDNGQTLQIFEASMDDQGLYTCIVENEAGSTSADFPLRVLVAPQFTTYLHHPEVVLTEGEPLVLNCKVYGDPEPDIHWKRLGTNSPAIYPKISEDGSIMRISRVTEMDSGLYSCIATNAAGSASRNFSVNVHAAPSFEVPHSGNRQLKLQRNLGDDVELFCKVNGNPKPQITWTFKGAPLQYILDMKYSMKDDNQTLIIHSIPSEYSGSYACKAANKAGAVSKDFDVTITKPPFIDGSDEFVTDVEQIAILEDDSVSLSCKGGGFPLPKYTWLWKNKPLNPSRISFQEVGPNLHLRKLRLENSGTFICVAENNAGTAEKHFQLQVQVPARIQDDSFETGNAKLENVQTEEFLVNSTVTLHCPAEGTPQPKITWTKNGQVLSGDILSDESAKQQTKRLDVSDNGKRLTIYYARPADAATYSCEASNAAGQDSLSINVSILDPPRIARLSDNSKPILVTEGDNVQLNCSFTGNPRPSTTWLLNGLSLDKMDSMPGVHIEPTTQNQTVVSLTKVSDKHSGIYTCLISSLAGVDEESFELNVATRPKLEEYVPEDVENVVTNSNRPIILQCPFTSVPPPTYQWYKNDQLISTSNPKYFVANDGKVLRILRASSEDAANYSCSATNPAGTNSKQFNVEVHVPPSLTESVADRISVEEGKAVELRCPVTGNPQPSIMWMRGSQILQRTFTTQNPQVLKIEKAGVKDQGRYSCLAANEAGTLEQKFNLNVLIPPKLKDAKQAILKKTIMVNRPVKISCFIVADKPVNISWFKNGELLSPSRTGVILDSSKLSLLISSSQSSDAGNYTCVASNAAGQINLTTSLEVHVPPTWTKSTKEQTSVTAVKGDVVVLICDSNGYPDPKILWLKNGQLPQENLNRPDAAQFMSRSLVISDVQESDGGLYTCIATNDAGMIEHDISLQVLVPPYLSRKPSRIRQVLQNRTATLDCPMRGEPFPDITWLINNKEVPRSSPFIQYSDRKRQIHLLSNTNSGKMMVTCYANNTAGEFSHTTIMEVLSPPQIVANPVEFVGALRNNSLRLECQATGYPKPDIQWVTEDGSIQEAHQINISKNRSTLLIGHVNEDTNGKYICIASNTVGSHEHSFNVEIFSRPIIDEPRDGTEIEVEIHSAALLTCDTQGDPSPQLTWLKDEEEIPAFDPVYIAKNGKYLHIPKVSGSHDGSYKCIATNLVGRDEIEFHVKTLIAPVIDEDIETSIVANLGDSVKIACPAVGVPPPYITWHKDTQELDAEKHVLSDNNGTLVIEEAKASDSGKYSCKAISSSGSTEMDFFVEIYVAPQIEEMSNNRSQAILGSDHTLHCNATGYPLPTITWTRRGSSIRPYLSKRISVSRDGKKLKIAQVRENDGGAYTCTATSLAGTDSRQTNLEVIVSPMIETANQPAFLSSTIGKWVELVCEASGNPMPTITWLRGKTILRPADNYHIVNDGARLKVLHLKLTDDGIYTCVANNSAGEVKRNITLQVIAPPTLVGEVKKKIAAPEGSNVVLECGITANPEPAYSWRSERGPLHASLNPTMKLEQDGKKLTIFRVNRQDSSTYQCSATNPAGTLSQTLELDVAVAPLIERSSVTRTTNVIEGGHVSLDCRILQGNPQPAIHWYQVHDQSEEKAISSGSTFILTNTTASSSGTYKCVATNDVGVAEKLFRLNVQTAPKFDVEALKRHDIHFEDKELQAYPPNGRPHKSSLSATKTVLSGSSAILPCSISGNPSPRLLWYKQTSPLITSPSIHYDQNGNVVFNKVSPHHEGVYSCVGVNLAGEAQMSVDLVVEGIPVLKGAAVEDSSALQGQSVLLDCQPSQNRASTGRVPRSKSFDIQWKKDGKILAKNASLHQLGYKLERNAMQLKISSLEAQLTGQYECEVSNRAGKAYKTFNVTIFSAPSIDHQQNRLQEAAIGEPIVLKCNATGQPLPQITWYRGTEEIVENEQYMFLDWSQILLITSAQETDAGEYSCIASNSAGASVEKFTLDVLVPPYINGPLEERIQILNGKRSELKCPASANPAPEIAWSFDNKLLENSTNIVIQNGSLLIDRISAQWTGEFVCEASNKVGSAKKIFNILVKEVPIIRGLDGTEFVTVIEGQSANLHCAADGQPQPSIHWERDSKGIRLDDRISVSWGGRSLLIANVRADDSGRYTCLATNSAGSDIAHYRLNVLQPAKITESPKEVVAVQGEIITIVCAITGNPSPKVSWFQNQYEIIDVFELNDQTNKELQELFDEVNITESRGILSSGALQFAPVKDTHEGNYTCKAENEAGSDFRTFPFHVLTPPAVTLQITPSVVVAGERVAFHCAVKGSSPVTVGWTKDGVPIRPRPEIEFDANGTLIVEKATLDFAGLYSCSARNPAGTDSQSAELSVQQAPSVKALKTELVASLGDSVLLECDVKGKPQPVLSWSRPDLGGKPVTPDDSRIQIWDTQLHISAVTNDDMGTYRCTANSRAGSDSANVALLVTSVPTVLEPLDEELTFLQGESVTLGCTVVSGYPPPSVAWVKDSRLIRGSSRMAIGANGDLVINNIREQDSGMYSCLVANVAGRLYRVATLTINVPPRLLQLPKTQQITLGDSLSLNCESQGHPTPLITWLLNGTELENTTPSVNGRGHFHIEHITKSDEGTYTCLAQNDAGYRKAVAGVRVKVPPVIRDFREDMTVQEQVAVVLTCFADGDPSPATTWTKEGHYIASSDRILVMRNGSLVINDSRSTDTGTYKCVAVNDAGAAEAITHLTVHSTPQITKRPQDKAVDVGNTVVFDCVSDSQPAPNMQWSISSGSLTPRHTVLTNGSFQIAAVQVEDEGEIVCQVFNEFGEDLAKVTLTVKVAGMWGEWSEWSPCSQTCGLGTKARNRTCDSPPPRNGGEDCKGERISTQACEDSMCAVNGMWSTWSSWSDCSTHCGNGTRLRTRTCSDPPPSGGGLECDGESSEETACKLNECPVNGEWSDWSAWTECSQSCGGGIKERARLCNSPPPSFGGQDCDGNGLEVSSCQDFNCEVDGNWGSWSSWTRCSSTCGRGFRVRNRLCDNPSASTGGTPCQGESQEKKLCQTGSCSINGQWSSWSMWSPCSVTCGSGYRERNRKCNKPTPENGGLPCRGRRSETQACTTSPCPNNGQWSSWGEWSSCSQSCGSGRRSRSRVCNNPPPRYGGSTCAGLSDETSTCHVLSCKDLPIKAVGSMWGRINGEDLGKISMAGNITTKADKRTLVSSFTPLIPQHATWLTPLVPIMSSASWSSALEKNNSSNGYTLTKGIFTRSSTVYFDSGETVEIIQTATGVDDTGALRFNVEVNGDVPYLEPGSFVTVQPYTEEHIQTTDGSLFVVSNRTFAVNGDAQPYRWEETIDYDPQTGLMPTFRQTVNSNAVTLSYRCQSGPNTRQTHGELSMMVSSTVEPNDMQQTCPNGFTFQDEGSNIFCRDDDECSFEHTKCSHKCRNLVGRYVCDCPTGYSLADDQYTCKDINECETLPLTCGPREKCHNTLGSFTCTYSCKSGFRHTPTGTSCEDIDECEEQESVCDQKCQNLLGSYSCDCFRGFYMESDGHCKDINECNVYGSPCSHDCVNTPGSFHCSCQPGFFLLNNGKCKDVDECATLSHDCSEGYKCINKIGSYECQPLCSSGYSADPSVCIMVDECAEGIDTCHVSQRCMDTWDSYVCTCPKGFKSIGPGQSCRDIDECTIRPSRCSYKCRNLRGSYECICPYGQIRLPDRKTCIDSPYYGYGDQNQYQYQPYSNSKYQKSPYRNRLLRKVYKATRCPIGFIYENEECVDLDECEKPGRCQHQCINTEGSYECACPQGYRLHEDQISCIDIDECKENVNLCEMPMSCSNLWGSYVCISEECKPGYTRSNRTRNCLKYCRGVNSCPENVDIMREVYQTVSIPSTVKAFQNLTRLIAYDEFGEMLLHDQFQLDDDKEIFEVRSENGKGVLYTKENLEHDSRYNILVQATEMKQEKNTYITDFYIYLHISQYTY